VDEHVETAVERVGGLREHAVEVVVGAHVALRHELRVHRRREVPNRLLDALALVRERELCAFGREPLRDRPGDRALVRDAEHERLLSLEPARHVAILKGSGHAWFRTHFA
jgi:hypothetical protein